jgi:hypothetical protein
MNKKAKDEREWSEAEFRGVELGDKRLETRLKRIAGELAALPEAPINQASEDWAATKAAYRFFQNERATSEAIFKPHAKRAIQRMRGAAVILAIQDTSYLNFSAHRKTRGLGPIGDSRSDNQGLVMHSTLAVTLEGLPLGLITSKIWAREGYSEQTDEERKETPIEEKESYRWLEGLKETGAKVPTGTRVVTICDRECDIYEFFITAQDHKAEFVVRASWDRHLNHPEFGQLWEQLEAQQCGGSYKVSVIQNENRAARTAQVEVRFSEVELRPPKRKEQKLPVVRLWAVYVSEPDPPRKAEPIEWMLLTNIPVASFRSASEKISWYCCRWQIEVFHKILKSGCTVEDCRLETADRLCRYITLMCIVAWRIFWMTYIRRTDPKASATKILTQHELQTLSALEHGAADNNNTKMSVAQAVIAIAKLGGFLARKHDRYPGPTVLWRGWAVLQNAALLGAIVFK